MMWIGIRRMKFIILRLVLMTKTEVAILIFLLTIVVVSSSFSRRV